MLLYSCSWLQKWDVEGGQLFIICGHVKMDTKKTRVFKTHWTTQWSNLVIIFDSTIHMNMEGGDVSEKNSIATICRGSSIAIHRKKIHKINHFG